MARRELAEINAGSMADIAFLLLVFFLMVTTMNTDSGMQRLLPPPLTGEEKPAVVNERNVYEVMVNFNNDLLVEGDRMNIRDLREGARGFLLSNGDNVLKPRASAIDDLPIRRVVGSLDSVRAIVRGVDIEIVDEEKELGKFKKLPQETEQEIEFRSAKIERSEKKIKNLNSQRDDALATQYAFEYFGNYASMPGSALISVLNDNSTNYETYIQVNNELEGALNDLRNELCLLKFDVRFDELDQEDDEDKKKILAVRKVYPQRISEAEPIDVKGFM